MKFITLLRHFSFIVFAVAFSHNGGFIYPEKNIPVEVDISRFTKTVTKNDLNKTIDLNGRWALFWHEFGKVYTDFETEPFDINIPGEWNNIKKNGKEIGGFGFGTYYLRIELPADYKTPVALHVPTIGTSYRLYANNRLVAQAGNPGVNAETTEPAFKPMISKVVDHNGVIELAMQVANFDDKAGGIWYPIRFGSLHELSIERENQLALELFLFGAILIMGIYHFALFNLRRQDLSALLFGIVCTMIALRLLLTGERYLVQMWSTIPYSLLIRLDFLSYYIAAPAFFHFFSVIFPQDFSQKLIRWIWGYFIVFILLVLFTPANFFSRTLFFFNIASLFLIGYTLIMVVLVSYRKREGAFLFATGAAIFAATVINDILYNFEIIYSDYYVPYGLLAFIFFQSVLLSMRFAKAFIRVEELSNELGSQNEKLKSLDKMKDEFLSNISHELRTPLNGIVGLAESMQSGATGELNSEAMYNLSLIASSGRRLESLVNDILDYQKLKQVDLELRFQQVDLYQLVEVVLLLSAPLAAGKPIKLVNAIGADAHPMVWADENRLQQIMHNLLGNAIKFTEKGEIKVSASTQGDFTRVSVHDTGIGIAPERITGIFNSFEQADGSINRKYGGTGLGLSISKSLVGLHGGSLSVESEPGRGSTFSFTIPQAQSTGSMVAQEKAHAITTEEQNNVTVPDFSFIKNSAAIEGDYAKSHVDLDKPLETIPDNAVEDNSEKPVALVVDDENVNIQVVMNHLGVAGYRVLTAHSGTEALEMIDQQFPDVILLDVMMPGLNGYETARRIREKYDSGTLPLLFLTAKNRSDDIVAGLKSGANDYLSKPFYAPELLARVNTLVNLKKTVKLQSSLAAIHKELELARELQLSMLQNNLPQSKKVDIAVEYEAMHSVGGDYYDIEMTDDRLNVFVSDVSGHGVSAALIVSMVKLGYWLQKKEQAPPDQALSNINQILCDNIATNFVTAQYIQIDLNTGKMLMARAGHPPVLVLRSQTNELVELLPQGSMLGAFSERKYQLLETQLQSGDRVILYTDGIYEAIEKDSEGKLIHERMFTEERMHRYIKDNKHLDTSAFAKALKDEVIRFSGSEQNLTDDLALVVVDVK